VHGVAQIGAGLFKAPGATITYMGETAELVTYWKPAKGFTAGIGATVKDRFILEARYFQLINTEIEGQVQVTGRGRLHDGPTRVLGAADGLHPRLVMASQGAFSAPHDRRQPPGEQRQEHQKDECEGDEKVPLALVHGLLNSLAP
jgi:hypothetical protein